MSGDASRRRARPTLHPPLRFHQNATRIRLFVCGAFAALLSAAILCFAPRLRAQSAAKAVIDQDCRAFDISSQNDIAYAVPHRKFIKKYILDRDDIFITTSNGKTNRIVDADKFIPAPPVEGFAVNSFSWSPDGKRIAVSMTLQPLPPRLEAEIERKKDKHKDKKKHDESSDDDDSDYQPSKPALGGRAVVLFDDRGREIQVSGAKSRFIEGASDATWLAGDRYIVYMAGDRIVRVRPSDGATTKLFEGHPFQAVAWDAPRSRAFAVGEDLTVRGGLALVELDLLQQRITPIAPLTSYRSSLTVSASGKWVGFFENGDTIEAIDLDNPSKPLRVNAGLGFFQFGPADRRVLLKRGPKGQSNNLVWVGLHDDSFTPVLHGLEYHEFQIAPDGNSLAVTEPGKRILKIYPLD